MTTFDEIYDRTLQEKYGSDGEYIAMHQMDSDFQRLFMTNIVKECVEVAYKYDEPKLSGPGMIIGGRIEDYFGINRE